MADILIRGMEMPKDCGHCRFAVDGWCYAYGRPNIDALLNNGITNFCPLVPLPAEHGRLIDADELDKCYYFDEQEKYDSYVVPIGVIRQNIKDAYTIVPAEGVAENG